MTAFATTPGLPLTPVSPLEDGLNCENYTLGGLNWLFQQLFAQVTAYTDCTGAPLSLTAALATCADLTAAIAALPGDKFLQGLHSYNPATNVLILQMNDGSTVNVNLTALIADAVASVPPPDGTETIVQSGNAAVTVSGTGSVTTPYLVGIDYNALATALCSNTIFQDCVTSLAGGGGPMLLAPVAPAGATLNCSVGAVFPYTSPAWTGTSPIVLTAVGVPAGVTFTDNANGTLTFGGVCPAAGSHTVTVTGTNGQGAASAVWTIISSAVAVPLAATLTFAPSAANLGGADPAAGTLSELLDVSWQALGGVPDGLNKALYLVVSGITGGIGPYTVDFSGVEWSITTDVTLAKGVEVFWGLNQHLVPITGAGNQSIAVGLTGQAGTAPAAAVVTGLTSADFASFAPRLRVPILLPRGATPILFTHGYAAGTVTVTDAASNTLVLTVPAYTDDWELVDAGSGGGGGGFSDESDANNN